VCYPRHGSSWFKLSLPIFASLRIFAKLPCPIGPFLIPLRCVFMIQVTWRVARGITRKTWEEYDAVPIPEET